MLLHQQVGVVGVDAVGRAPLRSREGEALGTLCVIDREPRTLTDDQKHALEALQRQVQAQLEIRDRPTLPPGYDIVQSLVLQSAIFDAAINREWPT